MATGHDNRSGLKGGTWKGGHFLAEGSNTLHYWLKVDNTEKITDRMVIKDLWSKESTMEPKAYQGIYDGLVHKGLDLGVDTSRPTGWARQKERFLREAYIQGFLTDDSGTSSSANTVPLRGYKKGLLSSIAKGTHWRLYMDYLHAGDLWNLMKNHRVPIGGGNTMQKPIAEAFIWWTLLCLAEALVEIDQRTATRTNARTQRDETIVLVDMKPPNILLDSRRGSRYPVYPKPLIADFGSAHLTYKDDPKNYRDELDIVDTTGFCAPETITYEEVDNGTDEPIHSWTNVWQTGRIIESMMRMEFVVKNNDWVEEDDEERESYIKSNPPTFDWSPDFEYSDDLKDIVYRCQRFDPNQRPTATELLTYINQHAWKHNGGMHDWGTKEWIKERERTLQYLSDDERAAMRIRGQERYGNGDLNFTRYFPDRDLAEQYIDFDMDLPDGCELAYEGKADTARIGYRDGEEEDDDDDMEEDDDMDEDEDEDEEDDDIEEDDDMEEDDMEDEEEDEDEDVPDALDEDDDDDDDDEYDA